MLTLMLKRLHGVSSGLTTLLGDTYSRDGGGGGGGVPMVTDE